MSETDRDEGGKFTEQVSEQDILKVFDAAEAPFLTAKEVAAELPITREAVIYRLKKMRERGIVESKKTGARAVGWWATVAPRLSEESAARVEQSREEIEAGETVALEDL